MSETIIEDRMSIREATTRYVAITCRDKATGEAFNFDGYTVQTFLKFGTHSQYADTTIVGNVVSYKIPASISLGARYGVAETRIFKNGDVYEVLRIDVKVYKAEKPDITPNE